MGAKIKTKRHLHTNLAVVSIVFTITCLAAIGFGNIKVEIETLCLFLVVTWAGLWLCNMAVVKLGDPNLKKLGVIWLLKLGAVLIFLYFGWIPYLDPDTSPAWGYDPQRFYVDAKTLIDQHWNPSASLNYQGILYYYGAIFTIFGYNPVAPALINAFVSLGAFTITLLFLYREGYGDRKAKSHIICYGLLIPEVLWYDALTARETLVAALVIFSIIPVAGIMLGYENKISRSPIWLAIFGFVGLITVRPPMVVPVVIVIAIIYVFLRKQREGKYWIRPAVAILALLSVTIIPLAQRLTGGYIFDLGQMFSTVSTFENNISASMEWESNSIGLLLAPSNIFEALIFTFPRMLLYLAAPLPNIGINYTDLLAGDWVAWQKLAIIPSAFAMVIGFPFVLAGTVHVVRNRNIYPSGFVVFCSFWVTFAAIAGGNIIIHERYRVMISTLLFFCMWWGFMNCQKWSIARYMINWYMMLVLGFCAYCMKKM